jgi:carboxyl-terminal processing protease
MARHRVPAALRSLLLVFGAVWAAGWALPSAAQSVPDVAELEQVVERGQQLELEGRWGDALALYEEALRDHPENESLEHGYQYCRMHYDLGRRYADASFREDLLGLTEHDALALYAEVLLMIQSHHVDQPDWNRLVERGMTGVEAALTDPAFVEQHLRHASSERIAQVRRETRALVADQPCGTRQEARAVVAQAARFAADRLDIPSAAIVLEFMAGATNSLDEYSGFLTGQQLDETYAQIEGNFVGLGVELKGEEGTLRILKVIVGSPAERGGLRAGDRIVAVDGRELADLPTDRASDLLQGAEGSWVDVTILARGESRRRTFRLRRAEVEVPSIDDVQMLDPQQGVAYFKLSGFQKTTGRDLDAALWKLHRQGMRSLIIDLRGNPGGLLTAAVDAVDRFVDRGAIVSTRGRNHAEDYNYSAKSDGTWRVPLVVLIDGDSASASEIFAGAIRDHRRGTLVGQRSYGKGSVQGIFSLNGARAGIRLTTARFYSPNGHPFSRVGVEPNVRVQQTARPVDGEVAGALDEQDAALAAALDAARDNVAQR